MAIIYILKNKINNKIYVGQTTRFFEERFKRHRYSFKNRVSLISTSIVKNGIENFEKYVFYGIPENLLDYFEIELIKRLNSLAPNGYNLESGGNKNKHHNKLSRDKISKATRGSNHPFWGKPRTIETKIALSKSLRKYSDEERKIRLMDLRKRRRAMPEHKSYMKSYRSTLDQKLKQRIRLEKRKGIK
jgi:group I intron endonuclease